MNLAYLHNAAIFVVNLRNGVFGYFHEDTREGFPLPVNVIESDLINGLRFISSNLDAFGISSDNIHVVTKGQVNEALFDIFFILKDLSIIQIPFENFFIHQQTFSNAMVMSDHSPEAWSALYAATGCSTFDCLKIAPTEELLNADQNLFKFTNEWHQQINRLFPFRAKYKFTFLIDPISFEYPTFTDDFDEFMNHILLDNRQHSDKIGIMIDYFYRQKLPAAMKDDATIIRDAFYDCFVRSSVGSTINATLSSRMIERTDDFSENLTKLADIIGLIQQADNYPLYTHSEKNCIEFTKLSPNNDKFTLENKGNCSLESIEFWNRVLPSVDVPYECHEEERLEIRPTFLTQNNVKITGRNIVEFGRPGLNTYFGVPYAKPPINDLQFQRPVRPSSPVDVDAGLYQKECVRNLQDLEYTSEDCLYLDIWQPLATNDPETKWSVIYFCDGYISLYGAVGNEAARTRCRNWMGYFTEDHDVISIHINYRQGIFGFGTDLDSISTNNGFADQKMALDWIYENIAAIGGDKDKIVFVGQGFGGISALLHGSEYKPHRIISSSATLNMKFPYSDDPTYISNQITEKLGCLGNLRECLSTMTTEQILSASRNVGIWPYGLVEDGELVRAPDSYDLSGIDLLLGINTGDAFGWANDQYNRLNAHLFGIHYDELEVMTHVIENDFMKQEKRSQSDDLKLHQKYGNDALDDGTDRYQIPLRKAMTNFYNDEGFLDRVHRTAQSRSQDSAKTYVYKFAINSWYTDIDRPLMVNSPKPEFAGAIRNDEADFVFKYFGSYPSDYYRFYNEEVMWTQDNVSSMWAQFIKTGEIQDEEAGFVARDYKYGQCMISIDYYEYLYMDCNFRRDYLDIWNSIVDS